VLRGLAFPSSTPQMTSAFLENNSIPMPNAGNRTHRCERCYVHFLTEGFLKAVNAKNIDFFGLWTSYKF